jgi:hypothetical protein
MHHLARLLQVAVVAVTALALVASAATTGDAGAALPPGNTVAQWNKIAEDTVVARARFSRRASSIWAMRQRPSTTPW